MLGVARPGVPWATQLRLITVHTLFLTTSAVAVLAAAAAIGQELNQEAPTITAGAVLATLAILELFNRRLILGLDQETPRGWLYQRPSIWAAKNGAMLGAIVATRMGFTVVLALVAVALFGAISPAAGAAIGLVYGLTRGLGVLLHLHHHRHTDRPVRPMWTSSFAQRRLHLLSSFAAVGTVAALSARLLP